MTAPSWVAVSRLEDRPAVALVALSRPEAGNAMSDESLRALACAFRTLSGEADLRAVVLRGEGRHFCSGADIEWMRRAGRLKGAAARKDARLLVEACRAVEECPVPVIARVHGACYGGGLGLLAACDIGLAAEDARFCFSEARLGILPAVISLFVLPKIGAAHARRWYLTAEAFTARDARGMGLLHEVLPEGELDGRVDAMLGGMLSCGPQAVREAKALLRRLGATASRAGRERLVLDALIRRRSSAEGQEGLSAFLEKRRAAWAA